MRPHDGRAVPTFLRQALSKKPVAVFGDGSQTRQLLLRRRLDPRLALLAESNVDEPVNVGKPAEMALLEMAELIVELTESHAEIVFEALLVDDPQVRQPDITRARQLLGWEPEIDVREGSRARSRTTPLRWGARSPLKSGPSRSTLWRLQSGPWADAVASRSCLLPPSSLPPARARSPWVMSVTTGHGLM